MITSMNNAGMAFNELARVVKDEERVVAEWEGVFEFDDGQWVYFLKCKHRMTAVFTSLSHLLNQKVGKFDHRFLHRLFCAIASKLC